MKKFFVTILSLFIGNICFAFDIVYPSKTELTINSPSTFFIGSSDMPLTINGKNIDIHRSKGFAHFVNLNEGENKFVIKSDLKEKTYIIKRNKNISNYNPPKEIDYESNKYLITISDNVPLRSTPIDGGINRMAHLQKDIQLISDGEKGDFYRVILNKSQHGWISKKSVILCDEFAQAKLISYDYSSTKDYYIFKFYFDRKVPFEIIEKEKFTLKFYNIENCPENTYAFEFPYKDFEYSNKLVGYSGTYDDNCFIFKVRKYPNINSKYPLKGIKIVIDAGHGGKEIGATGCLGDKEKDINLKISKNLENELISRGANVFMTRTDDSYLELYNRVKFANEKDTPFFISIHANALPDSLNPNEHRGTSIYYYYNQAKPFAEKILNSIVCQTHTNNDLVRQESYAVVRNTNALSILIEIAYLINPADNEMLTDETFQKNVAKSIADGVINFLTE